LLSFITCCRMLFINDKLAQSCRGVVLQVKLCSRRALAFVILIFICWGFGRFSRC
jgi:hypothetical protein